jgi:hypothetical protein
MGGASDVRSCVVDRSETHGVVTELMRIMHETGLRRTLSIGKLVLDRFFGGSVESWRDRRRNKNNSVRRLANCAECPLSRSALNQAIAVYAAVQARPALGLLEHIDASHITAVLPLESADQQRWLERADHERWSVRRLHEEVLADRRRQGERRGRPRASPGAKSLTRARRTLVSLELAVHELENAELDATSEGLLVELGSRLVTLKARLTGLHRALREVPDRVTSAPADLSTPSLLNIG